MTCQESHSRKTRMSLPPLNLAFENCVKHARLRACWRCGDSSRVQDGVTVHFEAPLTPGSRPTPGQVGGGSVLLSWQEAQSSRHLQAAPPAQPRPHPDASPAVPQHPTRHRCPSLQLQGPGAAPSFPQGARAPKLGEGATGASQGHAHADLAPVPFPTAPSFMPPASPGEASRRWSQGGLKGR